MTNAFSYLRVSGQSQIDRDGFPRQRAAIRKWAAAHDNRIVQEFVEKAVSGATDWDHRPAWTAMLEAILANGVRTIIVEQLTRVARDVGVQENIILDLRKRGIVIVSATEDLDLMSKDPRSRRDAADVRSFLAVREGDVGGEASRRSRAEEGSGATLW